MNTPFLLMFLLGTNFATGAVILRDESLGVPLEHWHEPSSISISQHYENTFTSGVSSSSSSSSIVSSGLPQHLHQGNNIYFKPQFLLPGAAPPSIAALVIPVIGEKEKANCDHKVEDNKESLNRKEAEKLEEVEMHKEVEMHAEVEKHKELEKPEELENHEELENQGELENQENIVPVVKPEQEILNDSEEKEPIVIPAPPELPPLNLPELPVPVDVSSIDQSVECNKEHMDKSENDKLAPSYEQPSGEDSKPLVIPQPPKLPSLVLPDLPIKVTVEVPVQNQFPVESPARPPPCEKPEDVIVPSHPEYDIPKEQNPLPVAPSVPGSISIENNVDNNELQNLENVIVLQEKDIPKPVIVTVFPSFPQIPFGLSQPPVPQIPFNLGLPHVVPANVPPCPPQGPHSSLVHDYVNRLGPQYQIIPVPPYKK